MLKKKKHDGKGMTRAVTSSFAVAVRGQQTIFRKLSMSTGTYMYESIGLLSGGVSVTWTGGWRRHVLDFYMTGSISGLR